MWIDDKQISLYECPADNIGQPTTFRRVLLSQFAIPHRYYYKVHTADKVAFPKGKWENGMSNDLNTLIDLRKSDLTKEVRTKYKQTMQCFTPAALLKTKKRNCVEEISRTGMLQLDFDEKDISAYDVEELKLCVFNLDFIAFCSLSCGGKGFYALAMIAEPYKLSGYAEQCFEVLLKYGIKVDTTKGKNVHDLRFLSYDPNMLIKRFPKPLEIKKFKPKPIKPQLDSSNLCSVVECNNAFIKSCLLKLKNAQPGARITTIQQVAYTLGGIGKPEILDQIKYTIKHSSQYEDGQEKALECASDCFRAGSLHPLIVKQ